MAENQNAYYFSGGDGNETRPRPTLPRTRSVVGPRPLPGGSNNNSKESRDAPYQHQKQYSLGSVSEYPIQNSTPQNFIPPQQYTFNSSDQSFPPLVSPKPQKPISTVTKNALETQYSGVNEYEMPYIPTTSDTPKSWYTGDDEKLNLASDQDQSPLPQNNIESRSNIIASQENQIFQLQQGAKELLFQDNRDIISNKQNINNNQYYQSSNIPLNQRQLDQNQTHPQHPPQQTQQYSQQQQQQYSQQYSQHQPQPYSQQQQQQQQQQQNIYYQHDNIPQYKAMPPNGNYQNVRSVNGPHHQSPQSTPPSSIHTTPKQSFPQNVNNIQQQSQYPVRNSQETVQGQYMQMKQQQYPNQMGQQTNYHQNNKVGSEPNSSTQISTPLQHFSTQLSHNDHSISNSNSPISPIQNPWNASSQGQFSMPEYRQGSPNIYQSSSSTGFFRQPSPGAVSVGPDGAPIPSSLNRGNWDQRSSTPERGVVRNLPNTNIRLLIDDKFERRKTMTSNTLVKDENALQKYRDAAKKTNDPNVQLDYAKFLINMIEYNPEAMYIKGNWYEYGKFGKEISHDKAFRLFLSASKQDFPKAIYKVAEHYEKNKDVKRGLQFYKKSASNGDVSALYRLALIYLLGDLKTEPDYNQALIYLKSAATKANEECPNGAYVYGMILAREWDKAEIPDQVVAPDDHEAKEYIQRAANLGYVPALYKMGHCYEYATLGCQFDPILSVSYYKRAAEKGDVEADMALSKWYLCGAEGFFEQNEALAYEHAEKAAMKGLAAAEFAMGYFHDVGIHVPVNPNHASVWYKKAAEHGNEDAKQRLARGGTITRLDHLQNQNKLKNERNEKSNKDCVIQ
ncbi:19791_t:CDS:2 [Funneliformis geosporum]|uniref:19791_t:CDS:1 n=1 Tax=Funneliformis geosporum TaxID=1117311 RepID=A0A9W4WIU2_9GLOM|nr:19791_t:CDS:2 [Funneliformis geosporum]